MDVYQNMDGKYWKTCNKDITSSEGWFRKIMLLGLVNLVPIFGQMTVQGYAYEWAHKAAWGVSSPMPGKIYGRVGSKMLRWGWFALVIVFLFLLVPELLSVIGDSLSDSAAASSSFWAHTSGSSFGRTAKGILGFLVSLLALVACVLNAIMAEVGTMRMVVYDKLGAGFQLQAIWKMMKHDATGLLRVVGMAVLFTCVVMAIAAAVAVVLLLLLLFVAVLGGAGSLIGSSAMGAGGASTLMSSLGSMLVMVGIMAMPVLLALWWAASCGSVWVTLLTARGMGYWTAQFCVAHWGTQDDPLPFEQPGYEQNRARWQQEQWQAQQQAAQTARPQRPEAQPAEAQQDGAGPEAQQAETKQAAHGGPQAGWRGAPTMRVQQPAAQTAGPQVQQQVARTMRTQQPAAQAPGGSQVAAEPQDAHADPAGEAPTEVRAQEADPAGEAPTGTLSSEAAGPEVPAAAGAAPVAQGAEPASPAGAQA